MIPFDRSRYKPGNPGHTNREYRQLRRYSFLEQYPHYTFTHPRPPYHTALTGVEESAGQFADRAQKLLLYKGVKYTAIGIIALNLGIFIAAKMQKK